MNANLRACIANIAARLAGHGTNSSVYDYTQGRHIHHAGSVSPEAVNVFALDRGAHLSGAPPNLYDHSLGVHVSLVMDGAAFWGLESGSGKKYAGKVRSGMVTIHDDETGLDHGYGVLTT